MSAIYYSQLETFIRVADAGSFNKASGESYITPSAIIKQINSLETELGVDLFTWTHRGLALTRAGKSFYNDAKYILEYQRKAIARAKVAMKEETSVVRIGTSPMTPAQLLTDLWPQIHQYCSDISFQLVPFENTLENTREIFKNLGEHIDVVTGVCDETLLELRKCAGLEISKEPICCAVSIYHPLAKKDTLSIEDLYGENIMMIHRGWSRSMDDESNPSGMEARNSVRNTLSAAAFQNVKKVFRCRPAGCIQKLSRSLQWFQVVADFQL